MNYRLASLLAAEAITATATKTLDINLASPISRIIIQVKGMNSTDVPTAHPAKMVTKIELVDGSDVLMSLSGMEAQALSYYSQGRMPHNVLNYINNVNAIATYELYFGRYLWDKMLAFDAKKFVNPQLKITHNIAAGGSAPDAGEISVFADTFDEQGITPMGFLMAKEQYGYTLEVSKNEHIDLATDRPYRGIMLMALSAGLMPSSGFDYVKLSEDNDRRVLINNERGWDLLKLNKMYPRMSELVMVSDIDAETTVFCTPTYETVVVGNGMDADEVTLFADQSFGGSFDATAGAAGNVQFLVNGQNPHGSIMMPFGIKDNIDDWFDVSKVGNLKLTIMAGSDASGTLEVVSEQLRKYGA